MLNSLSDLHGYVDKSQLTRELGGSLDYNHSQWMHHRTVSQHPELHQIYSQTVLSPPFGPSWENGPKQSCTWTCWNIFRRDAGLFHNSKLTASEGNILVLFQMIILSRHCSCLAADSASGGLHMHEAERRGNCCGTQLPDLTLKLKGCKL